MILLIVDDQCSILKGLRLGIDWKSIGITELHTAQNAMEARLVFKKNVPDVMLCDIEMPVENGLALCRWVRDKKYETKIIFLTCHSEFTYAQEAIKLNAFDYVLQPATPEKIVAAVQKAINEIEVEEKQNQVVAKAERIFYKKQLILSSTWQSFLIGVNKEKVLEVWEGMPKKDKKGFLILIEAVRWAENQKIWTDYEMEGTLYNTMLDLFDSYEPDIVCAWMGNMTASVLLVPRNKELSEPIIEKMLDYLCGLYEMYMPCKLAYSFEGPVEIAVMPQIWTRLLEQKNNNVGSHPGKICCSNGYNVIELEKQIAIWKEQLIEGETKAFEENAFEWLDDFTDHGLMNAHGLQTLCHMLVQMLYNEHLVEMSDIVQKEIVMERIQSGGDSIENMKQLISWIAVYCEECNGKGSTSVVEQIKSYIDHHLENNIRKEELSELVHLDADYITRCFKKEMGIAVKTYIIQKKMEMAQQLLMHTNLPISHIAMRLGYVSQSHFSTTYKKMFGYTPLEEQKIGEKVSK